MNLGFVSAILDEQSFEDVVSFSSKEKFDHLEIMCWPPGKAERRYAGVTHIEVTNLSDDDIKSIHNTLREENNIKISGLGYYPNPMDGNLEQREFYIDHIKKIIVAANRLGIDVVNTFVGRNQFKNIEENLEKFPLVWGPIVSFAEDHNVKIGIENCAMYFTLDEWPAGQNLAYSPEIWKRMFEMIPSPNFGLNYDPSHLLWMQMDYIQPIYDFKDRIVHVHVKDAKVHYEKLKQVGILAAPLEYHSPKLPGLGDINWGNFFSALNDIRYQGAVSIEVEDKAYEGSLESRKRAIAQSGDYVRQFIGWSQEK